ncbi:MAG: dihydroorotate dehydrogenase electron transfer subunit [Terracidiphilus sp.]|nr:dihydroorotate dehydrogenase electron transfer subunit [Terracidiphilus sp.]
MDLTFSPVPFAASDPAASAIAPPPFPVLEQACRVLRNECIGDDYFHMVLDCPQGARGNAGQFYHLLCPASEAGQPFLRRPMSIYALDPDAHRLEFLYKRIGLGTLGLTRLVPGDVLNVVGPLGHGFQFSAHWRSIVLVGRGAGLATLAPVADEARRRGLAITAILSARTPEAVVSAERFRAAGTELIAVTDAEATSNVEHVEQQLRALMRDGRADAFFSCGSRRLTALLQRLCAEKNIPGQVAIEQQMACGLGMCFCCVREFHSAGKLVQRKVCTEGPVFNLAEVAL